MLRAIQALDDAFVLHPNPQEGVHWESQPLTLPSWVPVWLPSAVLNKGRLAVAEQLLQAGLFEEAIQELCSLESVCARAKAGELLAALRQLLRLQLSEASQAALSALSKQRLDHYTRWVRKDWRAMEKHPATNVLALGGAQPRISVVHADYQAFTATPLYRSPPASFEESSWVRSRILGGRNDFDPLLFTMKGHDEGVLSVALSADGSRIVSGS